MATRNAATLFQVDPQLRAQMALLLGRAADEARSAPPAGMRFLEDLERQRAQLFGDDEALQQQVMQRNLAQRDELGKVLMSVFAQQAVTGPQNLLQHMDHRADRESANALGFAGLGQNAALARENMAFQQSENAAGRAFTREENQAAREAERRAKQAEAFMSDDVVNAARQDAARQGRFIPAGTLPTAEDFAAMGQRVGFQAASEAEAGWAQRAQEALQRWRKTGAPGMFRQADYSGLERELQGLRDEIAARIPEGPARQAVLARVLQPIEQQTQKRGGPGGAAGARLGARRGLEQSLPAGVGTAASLLLAKR